MIEPKQINEFVQSVLDGMPEGLKKMPDELKAQFKSTLIATANKMDLVSRETFDIQAGVLARTREKLEALEKRVGELEKQQDS